MYCFYLALLSTCAFCTKKSSLTIIRRQTGLRVDPSPYTIRFVMTQEVHLAFDWITGSRIQWHRARLKNAAI